MFLNLLKNEEKIAFLKLAHYTARSNNDFSQEQKIIIQSYCLEMQIENFDFNETEFDLIENLKIISDEQSKKIFLLELMALIYSNNKIDNEEQEVLDILISEFKINPSLIDIYGEWTKAILAISKQGEALIKI